MVKPRVDLKFARLASMAWVVAFAAFFEILNGQSLPELTTVRAVRSPRLRMELSILAIPARAFLH
jgi:hypothetical protein